VILEDHLNVIIHLVKVAILGILQYKISQDVKAVVIKLAAKATVV
jgi:hypothetical protein